MASAGYAACAAEEKLDRFEKFNMHENLLRGVFSAGYFKPTAFQEQAFRAAASGSHVIGQAPSGAGKTVCFILGALQRLDLEQNTCQALFLTSTREAAQNLNKLIGTLSTHMEGLRCLACLGGTSGRQDIVSLKNGQHVVVSTPGRCIDLMTKMHLKIDDLTTFILDNVDDVFTRGFKGQVNDILKALPPEVQIQLYGTSISEEVLETTSEFMANPVSISVAPEALTIEGVRHFYVEVEDADWKLDTLCDLYESVSILQAIVYVNSKRKVNDFAAMLNEKSFSVSTIHNGKDEKEREMIMREFASGSSTMLISTDLPSPGLDAQSVSLILCCELPENVEDYLQRVGRRGRTGRLVNVINMVTPGELPLMQSIANHYGVLMEELPDDVESQLAE